MEDKRLTRRECLARGAGAVVATGLAAVGGYLLYDPKGDAGLRGPKGRSARLKNYFAVVDYPDSHPRISVATGGQEPPVREGTLAPDNSVEKLVRAAVTGLDPARDMKRFITTGDIVLIKPNVGFDRPPHLGATTNPEVLRAAIRLCKEAGAGEVIITDNPIESPEACFAKSGIARVAEAEGAKVVLPAQSRFEMLSQAPKSSQAPSWVRESPLAPRQALDHWPILYQPLERATKLIGIAPVKDHNLAGGSMNLKNWYGLLGGRRNQLHQAIHETISDLALLLSPTLVIADATRVMMRNGPTGGRVSDVRPGGKLGRPAVIASVDPVACDAWCYENLLGRDPGQLTYLALAHEKIGVRIAAGEKRFGECDWQLYERQGTIATASV